MTTDTHPRLDPGLGTERSTRTVAAIALGAAGALHVVLALAYLGHDVRLFALFVAAGVAQLVAAPPAWRGPRAVRDTAVIAITAAAFVVDVGIRNIGLPVGSAAGQALDPLGIALALCGAVALAGLPLALPPRWRTWTGTAVAAIAVGVWSVWVAGLTLWG